MPSDTEPLSFDLYHPQPLLLIISGTSAAGKDAVLGALKGRDLPLYFVVTCTTRAPRDKEQEGVDYFFVSKEKFEQMIAKNELLEYSLVYQDYKGVPKSQIRQAMQSGKDVVLRVDVQGAQKIKKICNDAVLIFILPPNAENWLERFKTRNSETAESLKVRIDTARNEVASIGQFDYIVVNQQGQLDRTVDTIEAIINAEHHQVHHKKVNL